MRRGFDLRNFPVLLLCLCSLVCPASLERQPKIGNQFVSSRKSNTFRIPIYKEAQVQTIVFGSGPLSYWR